MWNSTSVLGLLLVLSIYSAGPIATNFVPFAAAVVYA